MLLEHALRLRVEVVAERLARCPRVADLLPFGWRRVEERETREGRTRQAYTLTLVARARSTASEAGTKGRPSEGGPVLVRCTLVQEGAQEQLEATRLDCSQVVPGRHNRPRRRKVVDVDGYRVVPADTCGQGHVGSVFGSPREHRPRDRTVPSVGCRSKRLQCSRQGRTVRAHGRREAYPLDAWRHVTACQLPEHGTQECEVASCLILVGDAF